MSHHGLKSQSPVCVFIHFIVCFLVKDEWLNQNIMRALMKYANQENDDWDVHLQAVMYGINTTKHVGVFLCLYKVTYHLQYVSPGYIVFLFIVVK